MLEIKLKIKRSSKIILQCNICNICFRKFRKSDLKLLVINETKEKKKEAVYQSEALILGPLGYGPSTLPLRHSAFHGVSC